MAVKSLGVWLNDVAVGEIREHYGHLSFVYSASWLQRPDAFALSAGLPLESYPITDQASSQSVRNFVASCLPEPGERLTRMAHAARLSEDDLLALLAHYGREGQGALHFGPPATAPDGLSALSLELAGQVLTTGVTGRGGLLPGRIGKMGVVKVRGEEGYHWPSALTASTHILKASAPGAAAYRRALLGEWLVQRLASEVGLPSVRPEIRYWREGEGALLEAPRFDRYQVPFGRPRPLCVTTAGQLLAVPAQTPLSPQLLSLLVEALTQQAAARRDLYRWVIFNILVGNKTAHLNKLMVIRGRNGWSLAPFFGLRSTVGNRHFREEAAINWAEATLPIPLEEATTYAGLDREGLVAFGHALGMTARLADDYVSRLSSQLHDTYLPATALDALLPGDRIYVQWLLDQVIHPLCRRMF